MNKRTSQTAHARIGVFSIGMISLATAGLAIWGIKKRFTRTFAPQIRATKKFINKHIVRPFTRTIRGIKKTYHRAKKFVKNTYHKAKKFVRRKWKSFKRFFKRRK